MSDPLNVQVVIPTYNEGENIGDLVKSMFATVPDIRILVVDDNSPDGTAGSVRSLQNSFPGLELLSRTTERGFGSAYVAGFRRILEDNYASAVLMMDADLFHSPAHVPDMINRLEVCDAVIGSRYAPGGAISGWEVWRRLLSTGGNTYVRAVTGMPFRDCTSGFNLIRSRVLRKVDLSGMKSNGYSFLMELKYRIWRAGAAVEEVPIVFRNRDRGESKISGRIIREGIRAPWQIRFERNAPRQRGQV